MIFNLSAELIGAQSLLVGDADFAVLTRHTQSTTTDEERTMRLADTSANGSRTRHVAGRALAQSPIKLFHLRAESARAMLEHLH
jgi:hypothetical protein